MKKYIKFIIGMILILSILLIIVVLNLIGYFNNKIEITNYENNEYQEELKCLLNEKLEINCNDTIIQEYNENNDLILYQEKNGELLKYEYIYKDKNLPERVKINSTVVNISYDNNMISSISYNNDNDSIFDYIFSYNENNELKEISKIYNGKNLGKIIYEYYLENNINYIKEIDNTQKIQRIRIIKSENILSNNTFHIINYIPYPLIKKREYLLFYDLTNVNTGSILGHYTPLFINRIEKEININNGNEKVITHNYDKNGRLIYIDNTDSYNYFKDTDNKTTRTTIYKEYSENDDITRCYKYKIIYEYDDNHITKFTKYKKIQITDKEYLKLKDKYLKYVYNNEDI